MVERCFIRSHLNLLDNLDDLSTHIFYNKCEGFHNGCNQDHHILHCRRLRIRILGILLCLASLCLETLSFPYNKKAFQDALSDSVKFSIIACFTFWSNTSASAKRLAGI